MRSLLKVPLSRNFAKIRQPAFFHEAIGEFRIHAVESQNYGPLKRCFSIGVSPADETKQLAEGPRHQRVERIEERNEDRPERRQDGKSRARSSVGMSKSGEQDHR